MLDFTLITSRLVFCLFSLHPYRIIIWVLDISGTFDVSSRNFFEGQEQLSSHSFQNFCLGIVPYLLLMLICMHSDLWQNNIDPVASLLIQHMCRIRHDAIPVIKGPASVRSSLLASHLDSAFLLFYWSSFHHPGCWSWVFILLTEISHFNITV